VSAGPAGQSGSAKTQVATDAALVAGGGDASRVNVSLTSGSAAGGSATGGGNALAHHQAKQPVQADASAPSFGAVGSAQAAPLVQAPQAFAAPQAAPGSAQSAAFEALANLAVEQGQAATRIVLSPEHLGGLQITLRMTSQGLKATMLAERPEAAQALHAAQDQLRDALQTQGLQLSSLDACVAGDAQQGSASRERAAFAGSGRTRSGSPAGSITPPELAPETLGPVTGGSQLPGAGRLIDLRA